MSYTLFLLLNVNHDKEKILHHLTQRLEPNGADSFCLDQSPDIFFTVEYLKEGQDTSLCIDIPFGSEEAVLQRVLDFMAFVEEKISFQVLDPQLGKLLHPAEAVEIVQYWKQLNMQALESYSDGHHFLRHVEIRDGKKDMIEAIRFKEETWQNHCSIALAYARVGQAGEAKKHFERALEMDPENPDICHALGITFFNLRDYRKAKDLFLRAVEGNPENQIARELIQDCERKLGF